VLTHPTIDQMHQLGLAGMARAFVELEANPQSTELSHAEWLGLLLIAKPPSATIGGCGHGCDTPGCATRQRSKTSIIAPPRGLDRTLFQALIAGRWIDEAQNLIIEGPAVSAKAGLPVPSATRPAATTARCSTGASPSSSPNSRSPAMTAATPA
jgi:hypothetical protein